MTEGLADGHGRPNESHQRLYRRWALGGAGLLITGNVQIDPMHLERPGNVTLDGHADLSRFEAWADAGRSGGSHLWMQISHAGRQTPKAINPHPLAPSAIPLNMPGDKFGSPRAMTEHEIHAVIRGFAIAALQAKRSGFTGVQIHGAHGYLLSQFLSPLANRRTDAWGGPLENRARLLLEVVAAVRAEVGREFPIAVKLNSADFQNGGFDAGESATVVQWLEAAGIDLLEISGGNYEQFKMFGRVDATAEGSKRAVRESTRRRESYFLDFAETLRPVMTIPLMVTGGMRRRIVMQKALELGSVDLIGLGRPMIVDPDCPRRLLTTAADAIVDIDGQLLLNPNELESPVDAATHESIELWGILNWYFLRLLDLGAGEDRLRDISCYGAFKAWQVQDTRLLMEINQARAPS